MATQNTTGFEVSANTNPFEAAMRRMVEAARGGQGGVASALGSLGGPLAGLRTAFEALAALAGGAFLKNAVDQTVQMTEKAMDLSRALGISTNEARTIQMALEDIGAEQGEFETAAKGMVRQLRENEDEMNKMGLVTRDAAGNLRPLNELVLDGIKVLGSYKEGADRALASQALFGRGVDASSKLMLYNQEAVEQSRQAMQELGLEVGANSTAAWESFDTASDRAAFGMQGLKKAIGDALLPVLTTLLEVFNGAMPLAITAVRGAVGGLASAFLGARNGVVVLWEGINAFIYSVVEPLRGLLEMMGRAMTGDFAGAASAFRAIGHNVGDVWQGAMDRMTASSRRTWDEITAIFERDTAAGSGGGPGDGTKTMAKQPKKEKADPGLMRAWEAELAAVKQAHADKNVAEGTFHEFSKAQEREFWEAKRTLADKGSKDAFAVQARITTATLELQKEAFETRLAQIQREQDAAQQDFVKKSELARQALELITQRYGAESRQAEEARRKIAELERAAAEQRRSLREMELAEVDAMAAHQVELARQRLEYEVQAGLASQADLLAAEQGFEQQRFAIQSQALERRLAQLDPSLNPVEYARIKAEILALEQQHQLSMQELANRSALQTSEPVRGMFASIQSGWANALKGMLSGATTMGQGIRAVFGSVFDAVTGMLAQMAAQWVAKQVMLQLFGKAMAVDTVIAESAKAGAGGIASMAAAPWPLNLSAPAFGASMASMALAFTSVASAAGGFDVPRGLNPLTQLHEEEMVLPARHANVIRDLADDEPRRAVPSGPPVVLRGASAGDFFIANRRELTKVLKDLVRDFVK